MNRLATLIRRQKTTLKFRVTVVVEPDEGGFHAFAPSLKGLHADGASETEAVRNLAEVLPAYITSLAKHGDPLPIGPDCTVELQEPQPRIPVGALMHYVTLQWPSLQTSGIS